MKKIVLYLIKFYQIYISPLKKPCCRFYPVCSRYAKISVERFGVCKGLWLSFKRFLKCNPLFRGGYDPVPEKNIELDS